MANDSSSKRFEQELTWLLHSFGEIRVGSNPTLLIFAFYPLFLGVNSTLGIPLFCLGIALRVRWNTQTLFSWGSSAVTYFIRFPTTTSVAYYERRWESRVSGASYKALLRTDAGIRYLVIKEIHQGKAKVLSLGILLERADVD